jgi:hypothetical protein
MPNAQTIAKLNRLIGQTPFFEVHVSRSFRLDQAADAHQALEQHYLGKISLHPAS